jgi:hypothetical protein
MIFEVSMPLQEQVENWQATHNRIARNGTSACVLELARSGHKR